MRRQRQKHGREPTIALINVVFLMLIFFMVAGTLAQPLDRELTLVETEDLDGRAPPDALIVHADGQLAYRGTPVADATAFLSLVDGPAQSQIRLVPDRDLPAETLVSLARELRAAGAEQVLIVTEQGLP